jgi:pimeloyl-ACP methyl ester carboxylesterase
MTCVRQDTYEAAAGSFESEPLVIHRRTDRPRNSRLVVLIHGLKGTRYGRKSTWGRLPGQLYQDLPELDLGLYQYRSALLPSRLRRHVDVEGEAELLIGVLRAHKSYTSIVLVGHSMGGLIAKASVAALAVQAGGEEMLRKICGLLLIATPQIGSHWVPKWAHWMTPETRTLSVHSDLCRRVNRVFQDHFDLRPVGDPHKPRKLPTWAVVAQDDLWVDRLSAEIGLKSGQVVLVPGSHTSIVKPVGPDAYPYEAVKRCVRKFFRLKEAPLEGMARRGKGLRFARATDADVERIYTLAAEFFGSDLSSVAQIREWLAVNPRLIWILEKKAEKESGREMAGYFCLLPLTLEAARSVREGTLTGVGIRGRDIAPPSQQPRFIYVGSIVGKGLTARAILLQELGRKIAEMASGDAVTLYTRPVTEDGLKVAKQNRMEPVDVTVTDGKGVYMGYVEPQD